MFINAITSTNTNQRTNFKKLVPLIIIPSLIASNYSLAFTPTNKKVSDICNFAIPATALLVSAYKKDYEGGEQALTSLLLVEAGIFGFKKAIKVTRPDGSDDQSVISGHAAATFMGAAYLEERYGWKYSAIPYALAAFTAYARVKLKKHRWSEVITGAALGQGVSYIITKPYYTKNQEKNSFQLSLQPKILTNTYQSKKVQRDLGMQLSISYRF